jgi:hypothetical protein
MKFSKLNLTIYCVFALVVNTALASNHHEQLIENAKKYCTEGSQMACKAKDYADIEKFKMKKDSTKPEELAEALFIGSKLQACKEDQKCFKGVANEFAIAEIKKQDELCKSGNKDGCFFKIHLDLQNQIFQSK